MLSVSSASFRPFLRAAGPVAAIEAVGAASSTAIMGLGLALLDATDSAPSARPSFARAAPFAAAGGLCVALLPASVAARYPHAFDKDFEGLLFLTSYHSFFGALAGAGFGAAAGLPFHPLSMATLTGVGPFLAVLFETALSLHGWSHSDGRNGGTGARSRGALGAVAAEQRALLPNGAEKLLGSEPKKDAAPNVSGWEKTYGSAVGQLEAPAQVTRAPRANWGEALACGLAVEALGTVYLLGISSAGYVLLTLCGAQHDASYTALARSALVGGALFSASFALRATLADARVGSMRRPSEGTMLFAHSFLSPLHQFVGTVAIGERPAVTTSITGIAGCSALLVGAFVTVFLAYLGAEVVQSLRRREEAVAPPGDAEASRCEGGNAAV